MDHKEAARKFVDNLLSDEAQKEPTVPLKAGEVDLPEWFDETRYNAACKFFWDNCYNVLGSMTVGLLTILAVPSILKVLIGSKRSSSPCTAYVRYLSTTLHMIVWFDDLKPGTISWKSLIEVRTRHLQASTSSNLKGTGIISQRDLALTQFGFFGLVILKPLEFGLCDDKRTLDAYTHFWRVIGYMIGIQDRYNICRETVEETKEVCHLLMRRVFTPCLTNVPEYFEHMTYVLLDALSTFNPVVEAGSFMYMAKYLSEVPGYVLTENDMRQIQDRIRKHLDGKSLDTGVDATELIEESAVEGIMPNPKQNILYFAHYQSLKTVPAYSQLQFKSKLLIEVIRFSAYLNTWYLGRIFLKVSFLIMLFFAKYLPILAILKFGLKKAFVDMFKIDPKDDTVPYTNGYYYSNRYV